MGLFGKKYKCATCGAKFKSENELREHGRVHTQAMPTSSSYSCAACGMSFSSESELRQHNQKIHRM